MAVKRSGSSYLLLVGVTAVLIAGSFLLYDLYKAFFGSQITEEQRRNITPINSSLSEEVLNNLRSRRQFSGRDLLGVESENYEVVSEPMATVPEEIPEKIEGEGETLPEETETTQATESSSIVEEGG